VREREVDGVPPGLAASDVAPAVAAAGRGLAVWWDTTPAERQRARMSRRLDFGAVWINTHLPFVSDLPHGGFGQSGHGKDLSMYGFEEYTRVKHVMSFLG
jgi:betaine-aldehyde dehydrogenase